MLKNKKDKIAGKSLVINTVLIVLNLLGLTLLAMGYHGSFEESAMGYKITGYVLIALTFVGIFFLKGWLLYSYLSRIIVGAVFIVSGVIKANDPVGFSLKLEEYFEDGALAYRIKEWLSWPTFSLEGLIDNALFLAVLICIVEIVIGALLLLGAKLRLASSLTLVMLVFFTFLTWHTKECVPEDTYMDVDVYALSSNDAQAMLSKAKHDDKIKILEKTSTSITVQEEKNVQCVLDCGCFGDAMKGSVGRSMTPAESFWKDIILLYLSILIFIPRRKIGLNDFKENVIFIVGATLIIGFLSFIFSWYFPIVFGLLLLILSLWIKRVGGKALGNEWGMIGVQLLLCIILVTYVLMYLPIRDYRPYSVGSNIIENMENGKPGEFENVMIYTNLKTGKDTTLTALDESTKPIWSNTEVWEYKSRETITIAAPILSSIQQFNPSIYVEELSEVEKEFPPVKAIIDSNTVQKVQLLDTSASVIQLMALGDTSLLHLDTNEVTLGDTVSLLSDDFTYISMKDYILEQDKILILVSRIIDDGNYSRVERLKNIAQKAKENNIPFICLTTSSQKDVEAFRKKTGLNIPTFKNDETELKVITRSNPTLMVIENAVVKGKYSSRVIPSWQWLTDNIFIKLHQENE